MTRRPPLTKAGLALREAERRAPHPVLDARKAVAAMASRPSRWRS